MATVVPEVMNAAKPVIITPAVGVASDLVIDGENGFIIPPCNPSVLAEKLRLLTENPELAAKMGRKGLERVSSWNFEVDEKGLFQVLEATPGDEGWMGN
jgi:glycosyltransferase involved in cell wall biosynthesis